MQCGSGASFKLLPLIISEHVVASPVSPAGLEETHGCKYQENIIHPLSDEVFAVMRVPRLSSDLKIPSRGVLCSRALPGNFRSTTVVGSYRCADKDCSTTLVQFCLGRLNISFRLRRSLWCIIEVII